MSDQKLKKLVMAALFAALTTVMTMVIRIPSPMSGYVNLGDCAVLLSAWILGPGTARSSCPPGFWVPDWAARRPGSAPCWPICWATPCTRRGPWW